jgi:hypothetical protein
MPQLSRHERQLRQGHLSCGKTPAHQLSQVLVQKMLRDL